MDRPLVRPTDPPQPTRIVAGVNGVTSISVQRRLADSRFATRWFVGTGLDVGAGTDSLALYTELFPMIRNVVAYDEPQGDAQLLSNVEDESFDFLYSSHCLEHLHDPYEALGNWIRVVKPGGHLVVNVPDEDLYEQGVWPSRFNPDHKSSWTIDKEESWSPVSINVLDLVRRFRGEALPLKIELIDHGYRASLWGHGIDQTRMPAAEAAIEIVLLKLQ
jgi:SAM-dependent methyltransferase